MANSILKLKVESEEYDVKLKKAAEGIRHLAEVAHRGGGELTGLEQSELDYIRALGEMETKSRSASGQLRELSNTYKELKVVYDQLNDVEKADEGGMALAASLEKLKQRAQDAKSQLDMATKSLNDNNDAGRNDSSMLEQLAQKFTINVDALKLFDVGLKAVNIALDVAKDAFFASEANVDEWGRTMASAEALYSGFVTALNTSDFSSFLTQIDGIVQAAREAYDELDKLGTMRTIQAPGFAKQEAENQRLRLMIMTGKFIEAGDGRKSPIGLKNGDTLSPEQIRTLERQLQNGMNKIVSLTKNELGQTGKAIDAYYNSLAKQNGMSIQEFRQGTSSWDAYQEKMRGYEQYQKWRRENTFTDAWGNRQVREGNPYQEFKKWGVFRVDKMGTNSYNDLVGLIKQQQQQQQQMYSTLGQTYRTINRTEGFTVRGLLNGGGGGKGGGGGSTNTEVVATTGSIDEQTKKVQDLQKAWRAAADDDSRQKIKAEIEEQQYLLDRMTGKEKFDPTKIQELTDLRGKQLTLTVTADAKDALEKVRAIEGVTIDDKAFTVTVTADDEKAAEKLRNLGAVEIGDKTFSVKANVGDTLEKVRAIEGVTIDDKTFDVTAETAEALRKLREIDGFTISPKTIEVTEESRPDLSSDMKRDKNGKWYDATVPVAPSEIKFSDGLQKWINYTQKRDSEKKEVNLTSEMSKIASGVSGIFSGIESLGVELPQGLKDVMGGIQGMISILASISTIVTAIQAISAADTLIPFARGGVVRAAFGYEVPGNHYSGDMVPALLNSGETVLNRAQSGILASALEGAGNGFKNGQIVGRIEGEKIVLVANRYFKRSGQGEIVTW